jgi:hypothetical protein
VENSSGGNKVDFYQDRSVSYDIELWSDGSAKGTADVQLTNNAPTTGEPRYVIGPRPGYVRAGESGQLVNVYCGAGCKLMEAHLDGTRVALWGGSELGHPFLQDYFRTPSGATSDLELTWFLPEAWQGDSSGGSYRLTFLNQGTIRPATVQVRIHAPDGMHLVETSPAMQVVEGDTAIWSGTPSRRLELEVTFQPSLLVRVWNELTGFFR